LIGKERKEERLRQAEKAQGTTPQNQEKN